MKALWQAAELQNLWGQADFQPRRTITGVSIDTRTLEPGDLFIPLQGPQFDGHDYIHAAFEKGAAACVTARPPQSDAEITVTDTLQALTDLGHEARRRFTGQLWAVTGSSGKTSVTHALAHALHAYGAAHHSVKSYNNHWGVPLSLARMPLGTQYAVQEMGMNHAGEIRHITGIGRPHVAIITTIGVAHLENFTNELGIADAKCEIFEGLVPSEGAAVIPQDNKHLPRIREHLAQLGITQVLSFGHHPEADVRITEQDLQADHLRLILDTPQGRQKVFLPVTGEHWASNAAAICAALIAGGLEAKQGLAALAEMAPVSGRGRRLKLRVPQGVIEVLDESYNANPQSMRAALDVLARQPGGRKVVILADMKELGSQSEQFHRDLAGPIQQSGAQLVLLLGEQMKHLQKALPASLPSQHYDQLSDLLEAVPACLRAHDVVMVKGSLSTAVHKVVEMLVSLSQS